MQQAVIESARRRGLDPVQILESVGLTVPPDMAKGKADAAIRQPAPEAPAETPSDTADAAKPKTPPETTPTAASETAPDTAPDTAPGASAQDRTGIV